MKVKSGSIMTIILIIVIMMIYGIAYYRSNYVSTIQEAIEKADIKYTDIFYVDKAKGCTIVFYGDGDVLSTGLIKKTMMGYEWIFGSGSQEFNLKEKYLTSGITNLPTEKQGDNTQVVSISLGVLYDKDIDTLKIKYKGEDYKKAVIINTHKGRIWFSYSNSSINYDAQIIALSKKGEIIMKR